MYAEDELWQKAAFARSGFRFDKFPNISVSVADQVAWHVETASWLARCKIDFPLCLILNQNT